MSKPVNGRPALSDEVKKRLKPLIIELRRTLEEDLERELRRLGLDRSKDSPLPVEALSYLTEQEREIRAELEAILAKEQESIGSFAGALEAVRREAAYTHLNRLVGLKCLELRSHLVIEGERTEAVTCRQEFGGRSKWLWTLRSRESRYRHGAQAEELLWREGLLQACAAVTQEIGVLFDPADPYAKVWPSFRTLRAVVDRLNELPEDAFRTDELLGWVYQYFQTEEKEKVTAGESFTQKLKKTKKITGADIATYTALYTERYMVDFLLQNSIGAYWMEMYPDSRAKEAWQYYVTPATPHTRLPKPLKEWKLLDPAMGSGHFLVVAFDLLAQLYEEERQMEAQGRLPRGWSVPAGQTARVILENNLHGIDIDLRAAQLAALALYLKAKELGWDEAGGPPRLNLVVADAVLSRGEAYERLLAQYKDDPAIQEAIRVIWHSLEHVRELGSLVRVEEEVEEAIRKIKATEERDIPLISSARDWEGYKQVLFQRLSEVFENENQNGNLTGRIFNVEGQKSVGLLELLSQQYEIVCANPPYLGSGNMGETLKEYISKNYELGKRDLYAAFVLRCIELAQQDGYLAMVSQQSWMFLNSYSDFRIRVIEKQENGFKGLLQETSITNLVHLGTNAFSEISGEVVNVVLFALRKYPPSEVHQITAFRLIGPKKPYEKANLLREAINKKQPDIQFAPLQRDLSFLPDGVVTYWAKPIFFSLLRSKKRVKDLAKVKQGLATGENNRFLRRFWEVPHRYDRWRKYAKGGGFGRWIAFEDWVIDWLYNGALIRNHPGSRFQNEQYYFKSGWTYSQVAQGSFGIRLLEDSVFDIKGSSIFFETNSNDTSKLIFWLNSTLATYLLRCLRPMLEFKEGTVSSLPFPDNLPSPITTPQQMCKYKAYLISYEPTERRFLGTGIERFAGDSLHSRLKMFLTEYNMISTIITTLHGISDFQIIHGCGLSDPDKETMFLETGTPASFYPIVREHVDLTNNQVHELSRLVDIIKEITNIEFISLSTYELEAKKKEINLVYATGPRVKVDELDDHGDSYSNEIESNYSGSRIPIPPENFIEEIAQTVKLHPISVFYLLNELQNTMDLVCPQIYKHNVEDYFSVTILRMLGYCWPMQDNSINDQNQFFMNPYWIDKDGIISLTSGTSETLINIINHYLDEIFGAERGSDIGREAGSILGWKKGDEWGKQKPLPLEKWFEQEFFKRHVSQFKKRPIAWHLTSPKGAFQAFVYYHKFDKDRLKLLRSRYVSETLKELRRQLGEAQNRAALDRKALNRVAELEEKIADVEEFDRRLGLLQEGRQREARIWVPWKSPEEQPVGWDPDINDGVRVNIAPVQRLGLLAAEVLSKKDLDSLLAPEGR